MLAAVAIFLAAAALVPSTTAQTCPAASDMTVIKDIAAGATVDNVGGEWGGTGTTSSFNGADGVKVVATALDGYWFMKFDTKECFDMGGYNAFSFSWSAPVGSSFAMTFTVHAANCTTYPNGCKGATPACVRQPDSTYVNITAFQTATGALQTVTVPLTSFVPNSLGTGVTDFNHIKDFTFINFYPLGAEFTLNNFVLKAGCVANTTTATSTSAVAGSTTVKASTAAGTGSSVVLSSTSAAAATTTKSGATSAFSSSGYAFTSFVAVAVVAAVAMLL